MYHFNYQLIYTGKTCLTSKVNDSNTVIDIIQPNITVG